jgi:hypothetical protein
VQTSVASTAGNGSVTITYSYALVITNSAELPGQLRGNPYSDQLETAGGVAPYRWKKTSILPKGMKLSRSGLLSGTPSTKLAPGPYSFSVKVTDSSRKAHQVATKVFTLDLS